MTGDSNPLTVSLSSFWAQGNGASPRREVEQISSVSSVKTWDEIVDWFEQQHEWLSLVSMFESAHG